MATVLTGLGVNSLSAASTALAAVGAKLSEVTLETCKKAAEAALDAEGATEARDAVRAVIDAAV